MTERKMGLVEGVLTDLKIMMDSAPFVSGFSQDQHQHQNPGYEFEPTPEYLNAISGPIPLQKNEVEETIPEDEYQQTLEQAMNSANAKSEIFTGGSAYRNLQIDESSSLASAAVPAINVTKLSPDLDSLTVKELQSLAKDNSIVVPTGTRRKDLIELLKKASLGSDTNGPVGTSLVPQADAPQGLQGSLLASDLPEANF